jgi:hypothetical protein
VNVIGEHSAGIQFGEVEVGMGQRNLVLNPYWREMKILIISYPKDEKC